MKDVTRAIQVIKDGGIAIFPTDTAFGIGCRIDDTEAIKRLFTLRKRPETKAVPVLTASLSMAQPYLKPVSEEVIEKLVKPYWPGGLTIVLPCKTDKVSVLIRGGSDTIGFRVPDHLTTLALIEGVGVPIVGTSANFSGEKTPYSFEDLDPTLVSLVDCVVAGETHGKEASTVIDCTQDPWRILRQGAVQINL
jgi:L-threonylcarbamoyladenylate synthase